MELVLFCICHRLPIQFTHMALARNCHSCTAQDEQSHEYIATENDDVSCIESIGSGTETRANNSL